MTTYITDELQKWMMENEPGKEYHYHRSYWDQTTFIRDRLSMLIFGSRDAKRGHIQVISTHTSKSITLPVVEMDVPDWGLRLTLRHNFHDWKVSVESSKPINVDFGDLFNAETNWSYLYCEGFPHDRVFTSYQVNAKAFTVELYTIMELYTFLWMLMHHLKTAKHDPL